MIIEILVSLFLVWTTFYIGNTLMKKRGLPPGPFPYPWIGNTPYILSNKAFRWRKLSEDYGEIVTVFLHNGAWVLLNTAALAREAKVASNNDFAGRSSDCVYPLEFIFGNDVVVSDYSTGYLFRKKVFKSSLHVFGSGIGRAEDRARHTALFALQEIEKSQSFSPREFVRSSIFAQVWEWLTSKKIALDDPNISLFNELQDIAMNKLIHLRFIYALIPFLGYVSNEFHRKIERGIEIKKQLFLPEYRSHRDTYKSGIIRDLTDSFISAYEKEIEKETHKDIGSMEDIPNLMFDVVIAGVDTSATTICWFLLYMVLYPEVQEKIQKELDDVVGKDRSPCWQDVQNMHYLQATLCEVMRKSATLPVTGTTTIRDTTIAGYHIPKNTIVVINVDEIHHDEKEWPQPNEFKPGRFLDSDEKFVGWTTKHSFMPFGLGRRECLGQLFAKIMMFTFSSTLLHHYKIELPEGAEKPTTMPTGVQVHHPVDFRVVAKKRKELFESKEIFS